MERSKFSLSAYIALKWTHIFDEMWVFLFCACSSRNVRLRSPSRGLLDGHPSVRTGPDDHRGRLGMKTEDKYLKCKPCRYDSKDPSVREPDGPDGRQEAGFGAEAPIAGCRRKCGATTNQKIKKGPGFLQALFLLRIYTDTIGSCQSWRPRCRSEGTTYSRRLKRLWQFEAL